ncbi:MAG TPA: 3-oxoacyl-[acyl-carrier-protein] synthase III C-terminal domain-containing protein, partial [Smithellaceae bacterium]|nr:3-oxoacyl-[acyl-carrier-protein] synthase III C-terminal domain-containing protein [Smithellaceae bacterium]
SQHTEAFGRRILDQLDLEGAETVDLYSLCGNPHTSSLIAGYDYLSARGLLKPGDRVLFVSSGAGLSAACSLYTV